MAANFVQVGNVVTVAAPADVSSGDGVIITDLFGVALHDALSGADVEIGVTGIFNLPADTGLSIAAGARLFWDTVNGWVDEGASSTMHCIGVAVAAQDTTAETIWVKLGFVNTTEVIA